MQYKNNLQIAKRKTFNITKREALKYVLKKASKLLEKNLQICHEKNLSMCYRNMDFNIVVKKVFMCHKSNHVWKTIKILV
jgi:hypothetical protein